MKTLKYVKVTPMSVCLLLLGSVVTISAEVNTYIFSSDNKAIKLERPINNKERQYGFESESNTLSFDRDIMKLKIAIDSKGALQCRSGLQSREGKEAKESILSMGNKIVDPMIKSITQDINNYKPEQYMTCTEFMIVEKINLLSKIDDPRIVEFFLSIFRSEIGSEDYFKQHNSGFKLQECRDLEIMKEYLSNSNDQRVIESIIKTISNQQLNNKMIVYYAMQILQKNNNPNNIDQLMSLLMKTSNKDEFIRFKSMIALMKTMEKYPEKFVSDVNIVNAFFSLKNTGYGYKEEDKKAAVWYLTKSKDLSFDPMIEFIKYPNKTNYKYDFREIVEEVLTNMGDIRAITPMLDKFNEDKFLTAVKRMDTPKVIDVLFSVLKGQNIANNKKATKALVSIGEPAVQPLIERLEDSDEDFRQRLFDALIEIGGPAIPSLIQLLKDNQKHDAAIKALQAIGPASIDSIVMSLGEGDAKFRRDLFELLVIFGPNSLDPLSKVAKNDENPSIRKEARVAISNIKANQLKEEKERLRQEKEERAEARVMAVAAAKQKSLLVGTWDCEIRRQGRTFANGGTRQFGANGILATNYPEPMRSKYEVTRDTLSIGDPRLPSPAMFSIIKLNKNELEFEPVSRALGLSTYCTKR